jgi:hypothetical protein
VVVVVLESLQSLYQLGQLDLLSVHGGRLKHEKYLYYAKAGPYLKAENPDALLAERIEALVSTEHAKWISDQERAGAAKPKEAES